jgi:hypothetical protein
VCETTATGTNAGKGRVAQQLTYDAYGEALTMSSLLPHPVLRCGHKGLFVDRLDAGVMSSGFIEYERIVPFGTMLCYNRNRTYSPMVGRFLQADPNASGLGLLIQSAMHGEAVSTGTQLLDLKARTADGDNLYEYLGSCTWTTSDPTGLWIQQAVSLGAEVVLRGLRGGLENMVEGYAFRMETYLDWATDWLEPDDWHSRLDNSWIGEAFHEGMADGVREALLDFVDPLGIRHWSEDDSEEPVMAGSLVQAGYRAARTVIRIRGPARFALQAAKKLQLATSSPADIARVFKQLGYKVRPHFVDRLRGVGKVTGRSPADPTRMGSLGLRTVDDVLEVLRKGKVVDAGSGSVAVVFGRVKIIMNPVNKMLEGIRH